ncbi:MAG: nicotinamide mononucleotide transporter [Bacteroidales bacterium]|nr:nicotinamide mononucleotide transporter [Bacteroidales bacterium]
MDFLSFFTQFYNNLLATGWLEFVAVAFGLASVWYARKEKIAVYPTGIINVLIYVYLCYHAGLYADMGINAFYFVMSVYGWYRWTRKDKQEKLLPISNLSRKSGLLFLLATALFYVLVRIVLVKFTDSTVPDFDAFTTAIFIIAMWLMAIKKIENWIFWIVGDALVIPLFAYKGLAFTGVQYMVFLALAISGFVEWRKRLKEGASS